jgi:hypothetical protein
MEVKQCTTCKQYKPSDQFYRNRAKRDGLSTECGGCSRAFSATYRSQNIVNSSSFGGSNRGKTTAACELLVRADLLRRGFEVTVPCSPTARHDLHVEIPTVGWVGVQVKAAALNKATGGLIYTRGLSVVRSPILALVFLPESRIEYRGAEEPLPPELLT